MARTRALPDAPGWNAGAAPAAVGGRLLAVLACAVSVPAEAQTWGGSIGLASDNVYRGISLDEGHPAWLADLHVEFAPGWVAGADAAAERSQTHALGAQFDLYLDRRWRLDDDWAAKLGVLHYDSNWVRYDQVVAAIGYRGRWTGSIAASPNAGRDVPGTPAHHGTALWAETTLHQPIAGPVAADFGFGYADVARVGGRNYRYANAGIDVVHGSLSFYLSRMWTSPITYSYPELYGEVIARSHLRWLAVVTWSFPE